MFVWLGGMNETQKPISSSEPPKRTTNICILIQYHPANHQSEPPTYVYTSNICTCVRTTTLALRFCVCTHALAFVFSFLSYAIWRCHVRCDNSCTARTPVQVSFKGEKEAEKDKINETTNKKETLWRVIALRNVIWRQYTRTAIYLLRC